ncbi:MAG TPA: hypothetical protein VM074_02520 [Solimonas sp.]|nr:hypothetical protein [Solimonas sp.]
MLISLAVGGCGTSVAPAQSVVAPRLAAGPYSCGSVQVPVMAPGATYDVKAQGAIADGHPHPLSERYRSLEEARVDYPAAQSLDQQIDGEALRKSVAMAIAAGAGRVYLPAGNYVVDKGPSVYDRGAVQLDGATNLRFEGDGPDRSIITLAAVADILNAKNSSNLVFRDLRLAGSRFTLPFPDAQYHGLHFINTRNILVENLVFSELRGDGVRTISDDSVTWAENLTVANSLFVNNGRAGASHQRGSRLLCYARNDFQHQDQGPDLAFEATGAERRQESDIWIVGNVMRRFAGDFSINAQGGENVAANGLPNAMGFHILNNVVDGGSVFMRNVDASEFSANRVRGSERVPGLDIGYVNDVVVSDNTIETASGKPVIRLRSREAVTHLSITGNQLTQQADGDEAQGIWAEDFAGSFVTISGNMLTGVGAGTGIRLDSISDGVDNPSLEISVNTVSRFAVGLRGAIRSSAPNTSYGDVNISANSFYGDPTASTQATAISLGPDDSTFTAGRLSLSDNLFGDGAGRPVAVDEDAHILAALEGVGCGAADGDIRGWAYQQGEAGNPSIAILIDSDTEPAATVSATVPRSDIDAYYGVAGARGFSFAVPPRFRDNMVHSVRIAPRIAGGFVPSRAARDFRCLPS